MSKEKLQLVSFMYKSMDENLIQSTTGIGGGQVCPLEFQLDPSRKFVIMMKSQNKNSNIFLWNTENYVKN